MSELHYQQNSFTEKIHYTGERLVDASIAVATTAGFVAMLGAGAIGKILESKPVILVRDEVELMYDKFSLKGIKK